MGNSSSNHGCYKSNCYFYTIKHHQFHNTMSNLFQEWLQVIYFYKSSFESFYIHGKQTPKFWKLILVLSYHGGHLRPTNFFVSLTLILLLSRLIQYAAIKDNKCAKYSATSVKTASTRLWNPDSKHSSTRETTWKTEHANFFHSRISTIPCAFDLLCVP